MYISSCEPIYLQPQPQRSSKEYIEDKTAHRGNGDSTLPQQGVSRANFAAVNGSPHKYRNTGLYYKPFLNFEVDGSLSSMEESKAAQLTPPGAHEVSHLPIVVKRIILD